MENVLGSFVNSVVNLDINFLYLLSYPYFVFGVLVFVILTCGVTAPYGRYSRSGWGLQVNGKLAWFVQEIPSFAIPFSFLFSDAPGLQRIPNFVFLALFLVHYFQRACVYPFLIKGGKSTPMFPFVSALLFCIVNGYLQASYILYHAVYPEQWWMEPHILIGVCMFVTGMFINIHSDHILRTLRKPGETGYKIPTGGVFDYVSGANFFGEMLEWAGFAVATWGFPAFAFSFFTCCNIGPRAYQHHQYYLQKFEDYPKGRKAVIPFLL